MKRVLSFLIIPAVCAGLGFVLASAEKTPAGLSDKEELGKRLFFDKNLSNPPGQNCAACHGPGVGYTGPDQAINKAGSVYEGAFKGRFGNRKPPSAAYAGGSPILRQEEESGNLVGGMFWDGRAQGDLLGDPLAEQALGPFLNPLEQNMPDKRSLILAVIKSDYAGLFEKVWGPGSLDAENRVDSTFASIGVSIAAYERSAEVSPFRSKFDDFWHAAKARGLDVAKINVSTAGNFANLGLSPAELNGLVLFATKAMCFECHTLASGNGMPPAFTDYGYDNLGVPKNPDNPFYRQDKVYNPDGANWVDKGLGGWFDKTVGSKRFASLNYGRFKVPTLRNVDLRPSPGFVKAYMHNGCFKRLKDVVHFYNTRDTAGAVWPPPEVGANVNVNKSGNLGLTEAEENAIVVFLAALSDRRR